MRYIFAILLLTACGKKADVVEEIQVDTLLIQSINRTDTIAKLITKVDHVIHVKEQKNAADIRAFKILKDSAKVVKTIVIHDTIIIKEKTNFWGRKRTTTDSMQSIDSTEYEKNY
jgi:hypothetical protein